MGEFNPQDNPSNGISLEAWAEMSTDPALGYTAHSALMQMAFYDGAMFPEWQGDAFVAMRGSWNRRPPAGYEVVRIDFERGQPVAIEPFLTDFLVQDGESWGYLGRLAGVAAAPDGAIFVSDDDQGVIYRISATNPADPFAGMRAEVPNPSLPPTPGPIALDLFEAEGAVQITSSFGGEPIPEQHSAD